MRKKTPTHIKKPVPGLVDKFPKHKPATASAVDCVMSRLHGGQLITVAGRPSIGKTTLAANIVARVSALTPNPMTSMVFSLEEGVDLFATRILSAVFCGSLRQAGNLLSHSPIVIDDTPGTSVPKLTGRSEQVMVNTKGLPQVGLILIDYVQLLRSGQERGAPADEISRVSPYLKKLAVDLNVPVVITSQLPRQVDERPDRRPILSDLAPPLSDASDTVILLSPGHVSLHNLS